MSWVDSRIPYLPHRGWKRDTREPWVKAIQVGDVMFFGPHKTLRVVRDVSHQQTRTCVTFAIRHCSWTKRCHTLYFHTDFKWQQISPAGFRVRLGSEIDERIWADLQNIHNPKDERVKCCEVSGVP